MAWGEEQRRLVSVDAFMWDLRRGMPVTWGVVVKHSMVLGVRQGG